jgi:hypothetical protein
MKHCDYDRDDNRHKKKEIRTMKKIMSLMLGLSLVLGSAAFAADDKKPDAPKEKKAKKAKKSKDAAAAGEKAAK